MGLFSNGNVDVLTVRLYIEKLCFFAINTFIVVETLFREHTKLVDSFLIRLSFSLIASTVVVIVPAIFYCNCTISAKAF